MLEKAPLAAAAAEAGGDGEEWATVAEKGIEGDARPLEGGVSSDCGGVC
jgi:hypothetical protein